MFWLWVTASSSFAFPLFLISFALVRSKFVHHHLLKDPSIPLMSGTKPQDMLMDLLEEILSVGVSHP